MIQYQDISLRFKDQVIFDHFNLTVRPGETILLNGPSGTGKSTLLKMLPGFSKPDEGTLSIDGKPLNRHNVKAFRSRISYISQDVDLRSDTLVGELLKEIFHYKINRALPDPLRQVEALSDEFGLKGDFRAKKIQELSGGERQRLGIILCLVLDREIWLLDEITSALDDELKDRVIRRIREKGRTVFVISHDRQWSDLDNIRTVSW